MDEPKHFVYGRSEDTVNSDQSKWIPDTKSTPSSRHRYRGRGTGYADDDYGNSYGQFGVNLFDFRKASQGSGLGWYRPEVGGQAAEMKRQSEDRGRQAAEWGGR